VDFKSMEQRYSAWRLLHESGDLSHEEFERRLAGMIGHDADGAEWRIDAETGRWLRREGSDWVADEPPTRKKPRTKRRKKPRQEPRVTPGAWLRANWGWLAVSAVGVVFVVVAVLVYRLIGETRVVGQRPTTAAQSGPGETPGGPTAAPVDINLPPTPTPKPTPIPEPKITDQGSPMILIAAGAFRMGSTEDEIDAAYDLCRTRFDEREKCEQQEFEVEAPPHQVTLDSYYIDRYEVTNDQFAEFLNEKDNKTEGGAPWLDASDPEVRIEREGGSWQALPKYGDHPVTEVTWYAAKAYCNWRGARLPTEAEWEKAARWDPKTGQVSYYPWGDQPPTPSLANYLSIVGGTASVGSFPSGASPSGVEDMAGNVFEWVFDWFDPDYYAQGDMVNPQGPDDGVKKVIRGGSWGDYAFLLHAANRGALTPNAGFNFIGFRCAKDLGSATP
jgi:formylglycine-generating enzyme required for sulfatase activity